MACEEGTLSIGFDDGDSFDGGEVASHESEGLLRTVLPGAEEGNSLFVRGVAGEVEAANALDRDDLALDEGAAGSSDGGDGGIFLQKADVGTAVRTADRLRVVAAVFWIMVFACTAVAHGEVFHGSAFAVVGRRFLDGEAGTAVGAVDEGMEVAGIFRVVEFAGAVIAGGDVGGNVDRALFMSAFDNLEIIETEAGGEFLGVHREDDGTSRGIVFDCVEESLAGRARTFGVDFDVGAFVGDGATDVMGAGEIGDEGTEADALDDAGDGRVEKGHGKVPFV